MTVTSIYTSDGTVPNGIKAQLIRRFENLKNIRSQGYLARWREISTMQRPRAFRDNPNTQSNQGANKHGDIINSVPLEAQRTLASGMMSGISSPSRPWFRITTNNPELAEKGTAKTWLSHVEDRIRTTLARSNVYKGFHQVYSDIGPFGTAVMYIEEDVEDVVRAYNFPIGSYALAAGPRGNVTTLYREVQMTVSQVVKHFGIENCSQRVKDAHREQRFEDAVQVIHCIEPRELHQRRGLKGSPTEKPWASYWFEHNGEDKLLRESGFEECPFMAPRWEVTGNDVYGFGPGEAAQGDCKALQLLERRKLQAADILTNPPMQVPAELQNKGLSLLPGDKVFVGMANASNVVRPAIDLPPQALTVLGVEIQQHEQRIRRAYYADLWLMLSNSDGPQMTAREVQERREEKLLQLGTVLEQLQDELLAPLIDRVFGILLRRGDIPPPPEELGGLELKVEYLSIMASAQKVLGTTSIERLSSFVTGVGAVMPEALDMLDPDAAVREYAISLGTPPELTRTEEEVAKRRSAKAAAQAQAAQVEQASVAAGAAKDLAAAPVGDTNALEQILKGYGVR